MGCSFQLRKDQSKRFKANGISLKWLLNMFSIFEGGFIIVYFLVLICAVDASLAKLFAVERKRNMKPLKRKRNFTLSFAFFGIKFDAL